MNKNIEDLEPYLGVQPGFFHALQRDDDWSLIIKLFSLFEAATTSLIVENLSHPELAAPFSSLQMGTSKNGKLAFVQALKLIPERHIKYIETLGWLRNKFAHNISSSRHDIKTFLDTLPSKRKKECRKYLNLIESSTIDGQEISGQNVFEETPRWAIFSSGQIVLEYIRQLTIAGQQVGKIEKERREQYAKQNGPTVIKAYGHKLEKPS